jgi:hypothetical protein
MCLRELPILATLITAEIETGMAEKSSPGPGKQTAKTWFGLEK